MSQSDDIWQWGILFLRKRIDMVYLSTVWVYLYFEFNRLPFCIEYEIIGRHSAVKIKLDLSFLILIPSCEYVMIGGIFRYIPILWTALIVFVQRLFIQNFAIRRCIFSTCQFVCICQT